jgi:hypothetical protein
MLNDLANRALRAVVRVMGQPITYTRSGQVKSATGVFQASHVGLDPETGVRVNSTQPVLLVNFEDLLFKPRQGDTVEVAGSVFQVRDPQPDGHNGWLLMLHRVGAADSIGLIYAETIIRANTIITAGA